MTRSPLLVDRRQAGLLVVDVQERLVPAMHSGEFLVNHVIQLAKGASVLNLPILATEQYRQGLGPTVPEVTAAIPGFSPLEKLAFSACGAPGFLANLQSRGVRDVLLCGIETHVCVLQTCLDLLGEGYRVFVVRDAMASRTHENHDAGVERMSGAGAVVVTVEMALFELLEQAGTAEFREILKLVK